MALAVAEFPVWQGERVEADALAALGLVRALGAQAWVVVLSVVLVNLPDVSTFVAAHPQVWAEFVGLVQADKTFTYLHNIIAAATPAPPAPAVLGAVQQQAAAEIQPQESAGAGVPLPVMPGASQTAAS
uniref:Uncharacterized protein n=1 Tax=Chlamydomonas leiostraca TaxID=1034604 RepID=A0A7S0REB6_9CHLO